MEESQRLSAPVVAIKEVAMQRKVNYKINIDIKENELASTDWGLNDLAWTLYWFVDFFNIAFFKDQPVPIPALTFERTRVNNLGYYRIGFNDFAVRDQINLNNLYLSCPLNETLQTLVHEMVHSFEHIYIPEKKRTKNWFHTKAFRAKLEKIGILSDERGCHFAVGDPFVHLLRQHGVSFKEAKRDANGFILIPPKTKPKGKSKLRKWSCGCQNARVGRKAFEAICKICGKEFEQVA